VNRPGGHQLLVALIGQSAWIARPLVKLARRTQPRRSSREITCDSRDMDVRMPGEDGLAAARRILVQETRTRVLILATFDLDEYVFEALRAGASGFLLKDMSGEDIVAAVRQAARGGDSVLAPAVTRRLIERFATSQRTVKFSSAALNDLTNRELEVLRLVARGMSNAEIAADYRLVRRRSRPTSRACS
jgi:DNA-binding NarL/FixJ family response regulator